MTNTLPVPVRLGSTSLTTESPDWAPEQELTYAPLIPEHVRRAHHVFVPTDHRFKAAARLLQGLWRENGGLPLGVYTDINGMRRRLGRTGLGRTTARKDRSAGSRVLRRSIASIWRTTAAQCASAFS